MGYLKAILALLGNGASAVAQFCGWRREKAARENAPDVRAAVIGQQQTDEQSRIEKEIAEQNAAAVRRRLAE